MTLSKLEHYKRALCQNKATCRLGDNTGEQIWPGSRTAFHIMADLRLSLPAVSLWVQFD